MMGALPKDPAFRRLIEIYLERTNDTVVVTDGELRDGTAGPLMLYVNPITATVMNAEYRSEDLIGQPLTALYPVDFGPTMLKQLRETAESRVPRQHETQGRDRNGRTVWLEVNTVPIFDVGGALRHFVRIGRDITVRKRIEQERETTQRLLASVFGVVDQALGVADDSGNFLMINTALTRQLGWSVIDLIGKPFTTVIEDSNRVWLKRQLAAREEVEQTTRLPAELLHRNGSVIRGEIVSAAIAQPDGRQYRVVTFIPRSAAAELVPEVSLQSAVRERLRRDGSPAAAVVGKVQMIGLADVRGALGERWHEVQESVFALADRILRRHLSPNDAAQRTADDGILVCFADLDEAAAQLKAQLVADEIRSTLSAVAPEMAATQVAGYAARISIDSGENGSDEAVIQSLEARLARERRRLETGALEVMRSGLAAAQIAFQRIRTETNQVAPFSMTRLPKPLETALDTLRALGRTDYGLEAELLLLTGAAERLLSELTANRTDVIIVPVRMSTLVQRRDAERWLQIARSMAQPGKRRLMVEITELSRDTARTRMTDLVMMISSLCRAVAFELPSAEPGFVAGVPTTVGVATIPLSRLANDEGTGHLPAALKLLKAMHHRSCRLLVKNIGSPMQAMALAKAGVPLLLPQQEPNVPG